MIRYNVPQKSDSGMLNIHSVKEILKSKLLRIF